MQLDPLDLRFGVLEPEVELHREAGTCSLTLSSEPVRPHQPRAGNYSTVSAFGENADNGNSMVRMPATTILWSEEAQQQRHCQNASNGD